MAPPISTELQALIDELKSLGDSDFAALVEKMDLLRQTELKALAALKDTESDLAAMAKTRLETGARSVTQLETQLDRLKEQAEAADKLRIAYKGIGGELDEQVLAADQAVVLEQKKLRIAKLELELKIKDKGVATKADVDNIKNAEKLLKSKKGIADTLKNSEESGKEFGESFSNMIKEGPNFKDALDTDNIQGGFKKLGALSKLNGAQFAAAGKKFLAGFGPMVFKRLLDGIKDLAFALVDVENEFMKATGANREFARGLTHSFEANRQYGVSMEENAATMASLHGTYTDFTMQDAATRESLTDTGAVLGKLGVSTADFATGIQNATKMFGQSGEQAGKTMMNLEAFAQDLGVSPQKMAADFAGAGSSLAKFGDQGVKAFKDLQYISKITGMELEKVLGIANKFDTFEDAAEQTGKLNAALGGNFVNAMDMMMETDPAERFKSIRGAILDAGLSFDEMSYYQKQFYTESLGLSDVGDLAKMLSGDFDALTGDLGKTSDELIDMKDRAAEVAGFQEKLKAAFASLIPIVTPLIDMLQDFSNTLAQNMHIIKKVVGVIALVTGVIMLLTGAMGPAGAGAIALSGTLIGFPKIATDIFNALKQLMGFVLGPFVTMWEALKDQWDDFKSRITDEDMEALSNLFTFWGKQIKISLLPILGVLWVIFKALALAIEGIFWVLKELTLLVVWFVELLAPLWETSVKIVDAWDQWIFGAKTLIETFETLYAAVGDFVGLLFEKDVGHSNFLEGIWKFATGFLDIGNMIEKIISPITNLVKAFTTLGEVIFKIFNSEGIKIFFEMFLSYIDKMLAPIQTIASTIATVFEKIFDPAAFGAMAEAIAKITVAIAEMPIAKGLSFTASMASFGLASTALAAVSKVAPGVATAALGTTAVENTTATVINTSQVIVKTEGGGTKDQNDQMKVSIKLDGMDLAKFLQGTVVEKIGELSRQALIS